MEDKIPQLISGFLTRTGWLMSWNQNQCVDQNGDFVPWYSYPAIDFIKSRLNNTISVFEFGCGYSTLFYAKHCGRVFSVDTKEEWVNKINKLSSNANLQNLEIMLVSSNFADSIDLIGEKFDLIIIDSAQRLECAIASYYNLAKNGIVILDNSDRENYYKIFNFFADRNFKQLTFSGLGPLRFDLSSTTVFYRSENIFNL